MKTGILFFMISLIVFGCGNQVSTKESPTEEKTVKEEDAVNKDLVFNKTCIIFYSPDSLEMIALQKETSQEEIASIDYYKTMAMDFLNEKEILVFIEDMRYYKFVKANGEETAIDKKAHQNWGMILFKPEKDPKVIFINSIMDEYDPYFNE